LGYGDTVDRGNGANELGDYLPFVNLGTGLLAKSISSLESSSCAYLNDASVKCWGFNSEGQLGREDTASVGTQINQMGNNLSPIAFPSGVTVKSLSSGHDHSGIITETELLFMWGAGIKGQLGNGQNNEDIGDSANEMGNYLVAVKLGTGTIPLQLSGGNTHSVFIFILFVSYILV